MHILIVSYSKEVDLLRRNLGFLDRNLIGDYTVHVVWNEHTIPPDLRMRYQTLRIYPLNSLIPESYSRSHPLVYRNTRTNKPGYWRQQVIKLTFPVPTRWCIDTKNRLWRPVDLRLYDAFHPKETLDETWKSSIEEYGDPNQKYRVNTPFLIRDTVFDLDHIMDTVQSHLEKHRNRGFSEFVYYSARTGDEPKRIHEYPIPFTHFYPDVLIPFRHY